MAYIPTRAALSNAAGRRGIPGLPGEDADQPEADVLGTLLPEPPAGGFSQAEYQGGRAPSAPPAGLSRVDPGSPRSREIGDFVAAMPDPRTQKLAERESRAVHAATAAGAARTDPSGGTSQGASQAYRGTGDVKSRTAETGGVTTGAPGGSIRVSVPGRGMEDYDPNDPSVRAAFAQQGRDSFMRHSDRTSPASRVSPAAANAAVPRMGPPSAAGHGGSLWTESDVPEGAQLENWDTYLKGREAKEQAFNTGMATSRADEAGAEARGARSEMLTEEPFMAENIEAGAKLSESQIKAATEISGRENVMKITSQAADAINRLRSDPRYTALPPDQRRKLEDQIWDQARLTLSALTKTNLYPRPDPYAFFGQAPSTPGEEKPSS